MSAGGWTDGIGLKVLIAGAASWAIGFYGELFAYLVAVLLADLLLGVYRALRGADFSWSKLPKWADKAVAYLVLINLAVLYVPHNPDAEPLVSWLYMTIIVGEISSIGRHVKALGAVQLAQRFIKRFSELSGDGDGTG